MIQHLLSSQNNILVARECFPPVSPMTVEPPEQIFERESPHPQGNP
jgi:hypothetical protein